MMSASSSNHGQRRSSMFDMATRPFMSTRDKDKDKDNSDKPANGTGFNSFLRRLSRAPLEPPNLSLLGGLRGRRDHDKSSGDVESGESDIIGLPLLDINGHVSTPLEPLDEDDDDEEDYSDSEIDWLDHTSPPRDKIRHAPSLASMDSADSTPSICSPHTLRPDDCRLAAAAAAAAAGYTPASHRSMNSLYDAASRRPSRQSNRSHRSHSLHSHSHEKINKSSSLPDISCHSPADWDCEAGEGEHVPPVIGPETEMVYKTLTRKLMFLDVARKGRLFSQRTRERLIYKSGESNISNANVHQRRFRYIVDIFTTLLELSWGYSILLYTLSFFISWCTFALCWWAISSYHTNQGGDSTCVSGVDQFTSALLFSIETQQTIGYGTRAVTITCPIAIIVMMLQSVFGVVLECIMTGLIFAKLALPKRRAETIMFSKTAVICMHKGNLCLVFRVGDMRKCHMIDVNVNSVMVKQRKKNAGKAKESDETPLRQYKLDLEAESEDFFFLAWPIHVIHKITENSPLWDMTPEKLLVADFEIIVVLEGIIESSGMTTQVRTSYLPSEIMWGHKLATLLTYQKDNGQYKIDYTQFHTVVPVDTPDMSAKDLAELNTYRAKGRRVSVRNSIHPAMLPTFRPQVSMVCETDEG